MPQFEHINQKIKQFQTTGQPAISVDTKKKELVGDFKNGGRELRPKGDPEPVRVHEFKIPQLGKVAPFGVYDIAANSAGSMLVSITIPPPSPSRVSGAGGMPWERAAISALPACLSPLIAVAATAARVRLWKRELHAFAQPMKPGYPSRLPTTHPAQASGIVSSIASLPSPRRTGAASR